MTPALLRRVAELTGGESQEAIIKIYQHNAEIAARLAIDYASLPKQDTIKKHLQEIQHREVRQKSESQIELMMAESIQQ